MTPVTTRQEENAMSRIAVDRIRFYAGVGIAASGASPWLTFIRGAAVDVP